MQRENASDSAIHPSLSPLFFPPNIGANQAIWNDLLTRGFQNVSVDRVSRHH